MSINLLQGFGRLRGEVGQYSVAAGAFEGQQGFQHDGLLLQPTAAKRGHMHGIFPTHLVGKGRCAQFIFDPAYNIQVGHAWLDHDSVGTIDIDILQILTACEAKLIAEDIEQTRARLVQLTSSGRV